MITKDLNVGTVITVGIFLTTQTITGVWWAATISADLGAMRSWQIRQDERLVNVETEITGSTRQNAAIMALLDVLKERVNDNKQEILLELRNRREKQQPQ